MFPHFFLNQSLPAVFNCKSVEIHLKAGNVFCALGNKMDMIWHRMKLAINDKEFLLTMELGIGTKMSCFSGTPAKKKHR